MRVGATMLAACCCAALLTACAGGGGPQNFQARPGERFTMKRTADPNGSLSDLASQVTTDTLLRYKGSKLVKAVPFVPCPGEAGEQTFDIPGPHGRQVLRVAFAEWNGTATVASYERPATARDDPNAVEALRRSVCSTSL